MLISLDSETTGLDFYHGARPFFVTICQESGKQLWWEWEVDPLTREPQIPAGDIEEIQAHLDDADEIVIQNAKFDVTCLGLVGLRVDWSKVQDTLVAGHLLASNQPHNPTDMVIHYIGVDIQPYEDAIQDVTNEARRLARSKYPKWRIAKEGLPDMPSAKEKTWKNDMWLPRALWKIGHRSDASWATSLAEYSNADSSVTLALWPEMKKRIEQRDLWDIYKTRLKVLPAACRMEQGAVSMSARRTKILKKEFGKTSEACHAKCVEISGGTLNNLPVNGRSKALEEVVFNRLGLVSSKRTGKGNQSMDKYVLEDWLNQTDPESEPHQFIKNLQYYRKRQTALGYIESYEKFWLPKGPDTRILYPTYNPTGTRLLRGSMSHPNGQQVGKQNLAEMGSLERGKNTRWMFGPGPGREWWSMDGQNLELRIPAYEAEEKDLTWVFDHPKDPPYYGSYHLVICDVLYPALFAQYGKEFKTEFEDTLYQYTKNGSFAMQYGGQEKKADATYRVPGAYRKIGQRFPRIKALGDRLKAIAAQTGQVETIPDRSLGTKRGYPLLCTMTEFGGVLPTTPLSYHVQGTAGWWINKAMIRCDEQICEWNEDGWDGRITLQVHDELVFDMPAGTGAEPWRFNLPRVRKLQQLMMLGGDDINVPTPCSVEYHPHDWSTGMAM